MSFKKVTPTKQDLATSLKQSAGSIGVDKALRDAIQELDGEVPSSLKVGDLIDQITETMSVEDAINADMVYNNLIDEDVYLPSGRPINSDEARALRNENRMEAIALHEEIEELIDNFYRFAEESTFAIEYDPEEEPDLNEFVEEVLLGTAGTITAKQYLQLLDIDAWNAQQEGENLIQEQDGDSGSSLNPYREFISRYELFANKDKAKAEIYLEGIGLFEARQQDISSNGMPSDSAHLLGYGVVRDLEVQSSSVIQTLNRVDSERSYIEAVLNRDLSEPQEYWLGDLSFEQVGTFLWENCLDCFHRGWSNMDFRFGLGIEFNTRQLLRDIRAVLNRLKFTLDIPTQILSNTCALMNLGLLCPVEIGFMIASLVGLTRFLILQVTNQGGFLKKLLYSILNALLRPLGIAFNLTVAPINLYAFCVTQKVETIIRAINETYRRTGSEELELYEENRPDPPRGSVFGRQEVGRALSGDQTSPAYLQAEEQGYVQDSSPRTQEHRAQITSGNSWDTSRDDNLAAYTTFASLLSPLEGANAGISDFVSKANQSAQWVQVMLSSLKAHARENSLNKMEVMASILACTTLISLLGAFARLITNNIPVCEAVDDNEITDSLLGGPGPFIVPNFSPAEMLEIMDPLNALQVERNSILLDGNIIETDNINNVVLVNSLTKNKFNLISCEKGKVMNVNQTTIKSILRNVNAN